MKKLLVTIVILLLTVPSYAARGVLTNTYSSWVSVTNVSDTSITFPANSRDIWLSNGSAVDVCISLDGSTMQQNCYESVTANDHDVFQLGAGQDIFLQDFITGGITIKSAADTASPVSVIITY